eukprot:gb/GECG01003724.1/.p1 GENE.gb/GECG01003724.1/~~gb/GECG01003724.1/.p1  ORF type:complete len:141 (+),score=1.58 gb/GECG01003724.1/:1-423(+)
MRFPLNRIDKCGIPPVSLAVTGSSCSVEALGKHHSLACRNSNTGLHWLEENEKILCPGSVSLLMCQKVRRDRRVRRLNRPRDQIIPVMSQHHESVVRGVSRIAQHCFMGLGIGASPLFRLLEPCLQVLATAKAFLDYLLG